MSTAKQSPKFKPADIVLYKNNPDYIVLSVSNIGQKGFNKYTIMNINNGQSMQVSSHELSKTADTMSDSENEEITVNEDGGDGKNQGFCLSNQKN